MGRKNEIIVTLAEHDLALDRLVEDFDELDQETTAALEEADSRLDTHSIWLADIGERLAALETPTKRKAS